MAAVQVEAEMERWEEERGRLEEVKGRLEHFHSQVGGGTGGMAGSIDGRLGQGWMEWGLLQTGGPARMADRGLRLREGRIGPDLVSWR